MRHTTTEQRTTKRNRRKWEWKWRLHAGWESLTDLVFPRSCPVCGEAVRGQEPYICEECVKSLTVIREPVCKKCGRPLENEQAQWCASCEKEIHRYRQAFSAYRYNDGMKQSIYRFKYMNRGEYAFYYGGEMVRLRGAERMKAAYDAIVPVPLHKKRYRKRGFNQAELLAREISLWVGIPMRKDLLRRVRNTRPMKDLNRMERKKNLTDAFETGGKPHRFFAGGAKGRRTTMPRRILLVDDIYTTGATADACAAVLLKNGAEYVDCYCLAMEDGN